MFRLICLCIGYGFGCIQTAFIVGKIIANIDIREHGSGNAGTTNVTRVLGAGPGLLVFIFDILKALIAFFICAYLFQGGIFLSGGENGVVPGIYAGLGVVLGHNFPFYLKFKGGKGIASTLGIILCVDLRVAAICFTCGIICVAITKYISLAALIMTFLFPVLLLVFNFNLEIVLISAVFTCLAFYLHRGNIERLRNGNERKFTFGKAEK